MNNNLIYKWRFRWRYRRGSLSDQLTPPARASRTVFRNHGSSFIIKIHGSNLYQIRHLWGLSTVFIMLLYDYCFKRNFESNQQVSRSLSENWTTSGKSILEYTTSSPSQKLMFLFLFLCRLNEKSLRSLRRDSMLLKIRGRLTTSVKSWEKPKLEKKPIYPVLHFTIPGTNLN